MAGCGGSGDRSRPADGPRPVPIPTGVGPRFLPRSYGSAVAHAAPVGRSRCRRGGRPLFVAHVELFARGRGVVVPAGIGVAPPRRRSGAFVRSGRCEYPLRTHAPTGVVEVATRQPATLGDLFAIWGQPLSRRRLAGFAARGGPGVRAFVDGAPAGDPRAVRLRPHAQIVLVVGPPVPVHGSYRFPLGE